MRNIIRSIGLSIFVTGLLSFFLPIFGYQFVVFMNNGYSTWNPFVGFAWVAVGFVLMWTTRVSKRRW